MPMLVDVLSFFESFTDRHHDKEEEALFPLLAKHGIGPDQTVVSALMSQHEAGRNRYHPSRTGRNVGLAVVVRPPTHDGAVGPQRETVLEAFILRMGRYL